MLIEDWSDWAAGWSKAPVFGPSSPRYADKKLTEDLGLTMKYPNVILLLNGFTGFPGGYTRVVFVDFVGLVMWEFSYVHT